VSTADDAEVTTKTARWVERFVIGLNLCPFAKAVHVKGLVRYVVSDSESTEDLLRDLRAELERLAQAPVSEVDTTLLIHPRVLTQFADYNDFLSEAEDLLVGLELEGELQIASFHPDYCFAGSVASDPANYTNRSPYPMLHLLREASVSRAVDTFPDPERIYERNIETLRALSNSGIERLLSDED
jgi:uncharacterized protein